MQRPFTPALVLLGCVLVSLGDAARADACNRWQHVATVGPGGGQDGEMVFDTEHGVCVLYNPGGTRQTWEWNGLGWSQRVTPVAPGAHSSFGFAYDTVRRVAVLFGGAGGGNETWELDGDAWTLRTPLASPPARQLPAMCFDAGRGVVVMHGGGEFDDVWEYDGQTWTPREPVGPTPGARVEHRMIYDAARGVSVLFGGVIDGIGVLGDTWTWDGIGWTPVATTGPPPRAQHSMAFDESRGVVVLFGGRNNGQSLNFNDTWEWNGASWAPGPVFGPPDPDAAMTYDSARRRTVLLAPAGNSSDTWELANLGAPAIDSHPAPQNVAIGQAAIFAVTATGDPTLSYRWRRNGTPLDNDGNISGALSPTLIINPTTMANAGNYDVVVTNACGTATSGTAALMVSIPCYGDTNGDLLVNFVDLNNVLGNYGANCQP